MRMKNPIKNLRNWAATLPEPWKTTYYALEATLVASLTVFIGNYYFSLTNDSPFNWHAQFHDLLIAVQIGVVKAALDLLKQLGTPVSPPSSPSP